MSAFCKTTRGFYTLSKGSEIFCKGVNVFIKGFEIFIKGFKVFNEESEDLIKGFKEIRKAKFVASLRTRPSTFAIRAKPTRKPKIAKELVLLPSRLDSLVQHERF
jgi:hypothetical protein